jgi:hypothetical protein
MSDLAPVPADPSPPLSPLEETAPLTSAVLRLGGLIGLIATLAGFAVLLAGCGGARWYALAPFIAAAGAAGLLISLVGATVQRRRIGEDTHVLIAFFANILAIAGGLLEMAVLKGWPLLPK